MSDATKELTLRVHDECNGSDVFGSDICSEFPFRYCYMFLCFLGANDGSLISRVRVYLVDHSMQTIPDIRHRGMCALRTTRGCGRGGLLP
jgi:hypothetical protein